MKAVKFWQIQAAAEAGVGELRLYGTIGSDGGLGWLFDEITPKRFKEDLDDLGPISELKVFINSEGGDVFAAQAIHSMLKRHSARVTVLVDGLAASSASIVVMAGDKVIMPGNAMMMVHNPCVLGSGTAQEHRHLADTLDQVRESMIAAYQGKTGMDREELLALLEAETWMTAEDAVELGFADEIEQSKRVAASVIGPGRVLINGEIVHLERYQNPPEFGPSPAPGEGRAGDTYSNQAASVIGALSEFERRTMDRLASREQAGRMLSDADIGRWEQIRDTVHRVLGRAASVKISEAEWLAMEYELTLAGRA